MTPDVTSSPVLVWVGVICAALALLAGTVPKVLGPLGESITAWQKRRAELAKAREDEERADLETANADLREQLAQERTDHAATRARFAQARLEWAARENRWRIEKSVLDRWIHRVTALLVGHEPPIDLAPDYMTPDPPKEIPHA